MRRFYYTGDSLDELECVQRDLEGCGIPRSQIYLLSNDDVGLDNHDVNRVASFLKTDVIHRRNWCFAGLAIAACVALVICRDVRSAGAICILAIVCLALHLGGRFIGIQRPNTHFVRFRKRNKGDTCFCRTRVR